MTTKIDTFGHQGSEIKQAKAWDPRLTAAAVQGYTQIVPDSGPATYYPGSLQGSTLQGDPNQGLIQPGPTPLDERWLQKASKRKHAYTFLESAVKEMKDRAAQRDVIDDGRKANAGERSMSSTVRAFNALTGHNLTEEEGWEFMILLKLVRGRQGDFRADDYTDAAAYSALLGECASNSR